MYQKKFWSEIIRGFLFVTIFCLGAFFVFVPDVFADGNIDSVNRYAWSENTGWIDFGIVSGSVTVTDSALTGYAYGENIGWVSLNCSNTSSCGTYSYGVLNDGSGVLSGYAWSENGGWINFKPDNGGVTISSSGVFSGYAYGENIGWINFSVDNPVTTSWRVVSSGESSSGGTVAVVHYGNGPIADENFVRDLRTLNPLSDEYKKKISDSVGIPPTTSQATTTVGNVLVSSVSGIRKDLFLGVKSIDVIYLQKFLNSTKYPVALVGPGSAGKETSYFGPATKSALGKWQRANNITPYVGYFGEKTRAKMNINNESLTTQSI